MAGLVIIVVFAGLGGLSNDIGTLIGLRAGWGVGNALFVSTALATIVSILVGNTEKAIMMYEAALGCGMAVGPLVGGILGSGSWRYPFYGVATLMFIGFLALAILLPEAGKPQRKVGFWEGVKALSNHKLRSVGLIALLYNFGFFTLLAYAPFLLVGYSELEVGFVFFGWGVLLAIARFCRTSTRTKIHYLPNDFSSVCFLYYLFGVTRCRFNYPNFSANQHCTFRFFPRDHQYIIDNDCYGDTRFTKKCGFFKL